MPQRGLVWSQQVSTDPQLDILSLNQVHHHHDAQQQEHQDVFFHIHNVPSELALKGTLIAILV